MKNTRTTESSQCVQCGGRLRNAVFCPACGGSCCSWACHSRHLSQHAAPVAAPQVPRPGRTASYPAAEARRDEWPDPMGGQAVAG